MAAAEGEKRVVEGPEVRERVAAFASAAKAGGVAVFLDFDRTVTRCFCSDGGRCTSAHGVMEQAGMLSEEFRSRTKQLFEKYFPIEIDATMSIPDKIPIMNEWYSQVHGLMLKEEVTQGSLKTAVADCKSMEFRDGMADFIQRCQEANPPIPVFIMSAGLGDIIEEFMKLRLPFPVAPTTMVVSNTMHFNDEGRLCGFSEPLLHMFNKTAGYLPEAARELMKERRHCLVVGDSVGDLTMADGLEGIQTLKVGFLSEKIEERFAQYSELFDVVVTHDGSVPDCLFQAIGA